MASRNGSSGAVLRWLVDELPFEKIERERVAGDTDLFYFLTAASFIEITSDIYTRSLIEYFDGDEALTDWLRHEWEPQELQHGAALRRYVNAVWPDFDWTTAYEDFRDAYAPLCKPELFGPTQGLELVARCVVETGTATFYTMIRDLTDEPVLSQLANLIRTDEAAHYSHFYQNFKRYRAAEGLGRKPILRGLMGRVAEIDNEDAWFAFRSINKLTHPGEDAAAAYHGHLQRIRKRMLGYYPYAMAATMLLRPLSLNQYLRRAAVPLLSATARQLFLLQSMKSRPLHAQATYAYKEP